MTYEQILRKVGIRVDVSELMSITKVDCACKDCVHNDGNHICKYKVIFIGKDGKCELMKYGG